MRCGVGVDVGVDVGLWLWLPVARCCEQAVQSEPRQKLVAVADPNLLNDPHGLACGVGDRAIRDAGALEVAFVPLVSELAVGQRAAEPGCLQGGGTLVTLRGRVQAHSEILARPLQRLQHHARRRDSARRRELAHNHTPDAANATLTTAVTRSLPSIQPPSTPVNPLSTTW